MASAVPQKGGCGMFSVDKCLQFIEKNGDREGYIIVKTDQEPSIEYLIKDLLEERAEGQNIGGGVVGSEQWEQWYREEGSPGS